MQSTSVLLSATCLFILFCGCRKDDHTLVLQKGLKGKIIYASCATIAVQVLNRNIGSDWTNCHDQQTYQNMIDVVIPEPPAWPVEGEFSFDIIADESRAKCYMADCGPSVSVAIAIIQD
ncbi:hypothetical protein L3C95_06025 [Chitinophaga filiformis]|uniref:hypothetical protein n=1 Tax=Chitinophaga filiformis TaxID=104663 RepID=UPI001F278FF2|nr:hypothetical protein [Chitinophaga filiformis]MCF6402424.1 hypothetical protein [Chitinophaga filiformis]